LEGYIAAIEQLPHINTPDVFGLHPNAEIGYYTNATKEMWTNLIFLQPNVSDSGAASRRYAHFAPTLCFGFLSHVV
jgi:dynein heavy chain, axonemal